MKREVMSFLNSIQSDIFQISKYIYENSEDSFHEYKCCDYLVKKLMFYNFNVTKNYLDIPTAFYAQYGKGHPKICFLCEYDGVINSGHIYGHNLVCSMSVGAAVGLSKVLSKPYGSAIVIGCPGEILGGSKITMARQGAFEDIDAVLIAKPHVVTATSGTSLNKFPYDNLISNETLSRLFSHNLKETGIIYIRPALNMASHLSLANVSHLVPTLEAFISIAEDKQITYGTKAFADSTLAPLATRRTLQVCNALALTGIDLIEKQNLLAEAKGQLFSKIH
jgi:metal-dependent amidase/aminoacylase/carboxypeptidase family protein